MQNWKTTLAGIVAALILALQTIADTLQHGVPINWVQIGLAFAIAVLGVVAKDAFSKTPPAALALVFALPFLNACGHAQLVAATTSSGHTYQYCLEVTNIIESGTLFCASLDAVTAEKAKREKECPAKTYAIVPAK